MALFDTPLFTNSVGINNDDIFNWSTTCDALRVHCIQIVKSWIKRVNNISSLVFQVLLLQDKEKISQKTNFDPLAWRQVWHLRNNTCAHGVT